MELTKTKIQLADMESTDVQDLLIELDEQSDIQVHFSDYLLVVQKHRLGLQVPYISVTPFFKGSGAEDALCELIPRMSTGEAAAKLQRVAKTANEVILVQANV